MIDRPAGDFTITCRSGTAIVNSITSAEKIALVGGMLEVATTMQVNNDFSLNGGNLKNATVLAGSGGQAMKVTSNENNRLDGVLMNADVGVDAGSFAVLHVVNGLTLNGTMSLGGDRARLYFDNTQSLLGSGAIVFTTAGYGDQELYVAGGSTLTIGPQMTVRGGRGVLLRSGAGAASLLNQGTIQADVSGYSITVAVDNVTNLGTARATGGVLDINASLVINDLGILASSPMGTIMVGGSLTGDTRNADLHSPLGTVRLDGVTSLLEVMSQDQSATSRSFQNNFAYGTLTLATGTTVQLVDQSDNATGSGAEAVYVNSLVVPANATLELNGFHIYARSSQILGTVVGGSVTEVADGGQVSFGTPTAGRIGTAGELDEWWFFGRSDQSVTVVTNPGANVLAPLMPHLNFAEVRVLDAGNNVLATGSSAGAGAVVTLSDIALPADGPYRIQISAPATQPQSTGNYLVTL